jgi:methyl-accepting chemotaxis protein
MTESTDNNLQLMLHKFESIMQYRGDMYSRLAERVRTVVRSGMAIISIVALLLFFLFYTLATQMQLAAESTKNIQANVSIVANNMSQMNTLVASLEKRLLVMENIQTNMGDITHNTGSMVQNVGDLNNEMNTMKQRMHSINSSMHRLSQSVSGIGGTVNRIGHDVGSMAKPASPFKSMPLP